jgi:hypothetical protein
LQTIHTNTNTHTPTEEKNVLNTWDFGKILLQNYIRNNNFQLIKYALVEIVWLLNINFIWNGENKGKEQTYKNIIKERKPAHIIFHDFARVEMKWIKCSSLWKLFNIGSEFMTKMHWSELMVSIEHQTYGYNMELCWLWKWKNQLVWCSIHKNLMSTSIWIPSELNRNVCNFYSARTCSKCLRRLIFYPPSIIYFRPTKNQTVLNSTTVSFCVVESIPEHVHHRMHETKFKHAMQ